MAFKIAGRMAFKEAMTARPTFLEPIMSVEVHAPSTSRATL